MFLGLGATALFADNIKEADSYFKQGMAKDDLHDYAGAIQDFNKAIELNPNFVAAYYNRGCAKVYLKDYTGAIQDYSKIIELNPKFIAEAYFSRGAAKFNLQDVFGALADYSKAGELGATQAYERIQRIQKTRK